MSTASRGRPISSSASRSAVSRRSSSPSSMSWRPPGKEISPAWRRRSSRRRVKTACSSPSSTYSGTSTAASMRPCTSSSAASSASRRRGRSASMVTATPGVALHRGDDLDALVEHDLAVERTVDRALRRDHHEAVDLLLRESIGQADNEREARRTPALRRGVLALDLDRADVPALAVGVHLQRDGRTRGERDGEVLLRARRRVVTPGLTGLVGTDDVVADLEVVLVGAGAAATRGGFHFRPCAVGDASANIVLRAANGRALCL